jgi:hypothetical protein
MLPFLIGSDLKEQRLRLSPSQGGNDEKAHTSRRIERK